MTNYLLSFAKILGIVVATRLVASAVIVGSFGMMSESFGFAMIFMAPLAYLICGVSFLALLGLPLMFCRSKKDFVAVVMAFAALLGLSEVAYGLDKASLAKEYATPVLATPSRGHDTAVVFGDQCAYAPYTTKFKYIVCVSNAKMTRTEAAPMSDCKAKKIEVEGKPCYVPVPSIPITDALVFYEVDGDHEPPKPLEMASTLRLPKASRSVVITEIADGKEKVLGRSFVSWGDENDFLVDLFFGYPPLFRLNDWSYVVITPPGMSDHDGTELLQALQTRATR